MEEELAKRLKIGTRVQTLSALHDKDYMPEARADRRWGVRGRVTGIHDSHGLCYDVLHGGTTGTYDPDEIKVLGDGGSQTFTDAEIIEEVLRLGRACLEMDKADAQNRSRLGDSGVGEKTDEVIRLKNRITQVARVVASERKEK